MDIPQATVHIYDINDDDGFPLYVYTNVIPRVGDEIYYWVDYPKHMENAHGCEGREPIKVEGTVERVSIEYRRMRYGNPDKVHTMVGVFLKDFKATLPEKSQ